MKSSRKLQKVEAAQQVGGKSSLCSSLHRCRLKTEKEKRTKRRQDSKESKLLSKCSFEETLQRRVRNVFGLLL